VDDHPIITLGLRKLLESGKEWQVLGEARTPEEALRMARSLHPQVVLMDMDFESGTAEHVTRDLVYECHAKVVVFSGFSKLAYIRIMAGAGASGYIIKGTPAAEILAALNIIYAGGSYFKGSVAEALANSVYAASKAEQLLLTAREREVLALLVHGNTSAEIAAELSITENTVKSHRAALMSKLNAENAADVSRIGFEMGLMDKDTP